MCHRKFKLIFTEHLKTVKKLMLTSLLLFVCFRVKITTPCSIATLSKCFNLMWLSVALYSKCDVWMFDLHPTSRPLVYSVSVLLPVAYIIGLIFTLKTHSHIYDIHVGDNTGKESALGWNHVCINCCKQGKWKSAPLPPSLSLSGASGHLGAVVHWSRWRAMFILILATVLMSACADLTTEHIQPILSQPGISQVSPLLATSKQTTRTLTDVCVGLIVHDTRFVPTVFHWCHCAGYGTRDPWDC